jgi:Adenylate and Guanylate cyclase catalytic domain
MRVVKPETKTKTKPGGFGVDNSEDEDCFSGGLSVIDSTATPTSHERYATQLTSEQSKAVYRLKAVVLSVLFVTACTVSGIIYIITRKGEVSEFNSEYDAIAGQIMESFQQVLLDRIYAISSLGLALTLHAAATNSTWPFVTMNQFQERARVAKELSGAMALHVVTIVDEQDRERWEQYTIQEQGWVAEAVDSQEQTGISRFFPETLQNLTTNPEDDPFNSYDAISKNIFGWDANFQQVATELPAPYQVIWQSSPLLPHHGINFDIRYFPTYSKYITNALETKEVVLGGISTSDPSWPDGLIPASSYYATLLTIARNETTYYQGGPFNEVYIPVFDTLDDDRKVVAVVYAVMDWAALFEKTLMKSGDVLDVVLQNTCDGNFTYSVSANSTTFVGAGDLHDTSFSHMGLDAAFDAEAFSRSSKLNFNQGGCAYTLHAYPAKLMMEHYLTPLPIILTALIGGIMAFTIMVFCIYNWSVERRQQRVLDAAMRTNAIVSSIFPEQVRDRLEAEALQGTTTKLRGYLSSPDQDADMDDAKGILRYKTKPIADFFASATVLFADVEGFTAWSSTREPFQVFSFLESLYGAFDHLATKHRIYKVETVVSVVPRKTVSFVCALSYQISFRETATSRYLAYPIQERCVVCV